MGKLRSILYLDTLWGSLLMSGLFFRSIDGGAIVSVEAPSECAEADVPFISAVVIGVLSKVVIKCIVSLVRKLHPRKFQYCKSWSKESKRGTLSKWHLLDLCMVILGFVFIMFSMLYVALFLAQVREPDKAAWAICCISAIVKGWLLMPFIKAFVLTLLLVGVKAGHPVFARVEKDFGVEDDIEEDMVQIEKEFGVDLIDAAGEKESNGEVTLAKAFTKETSQDANDKPPVPDDKSHKDDNKVDSAGEERSLHAQERLWPLGGLCHCTPYMCTPSQPQQQQ